MRNSIKAVVKKLEEIRIKVEMYQRNAEDLGNDERLEMLENEIECIENAIEALYEIE